MAFKVFISHSMDDVGLLDQLKYWLVINGIEAHLAPFIALSGVTLPPRMLTAIKECDCFIVVLTADGRRVTNVNEEAAMAYSCHRPIVPLVERGVSPPGILAQTGWIVFDPANPLTAMDQATKFVANLKQSREITEQTIAIVALLLGLFALSAAVAHRESAALP